MSTIRRLFFYVVSLVALVVAANGSALLIRYLVDVALGRQLSGSTNTASLGLAMVIVAGPVWALTWTYAQRQARRDADEAGSLLRKLYVYGAMFIAAIFVFMAVQSLLRWVFGATTSFNPTWVGHIAIWGGVWAFHWTNEQREGQPSGGARTVRRWYLYVTSGYTLAVLAVGMANFLEEFFTRAYDGMLGTTIVDGPSETALWSFAARTALASTITGALSWGLHWLVLARGDVESRLRQVYLYLFAFLGGALTVLVAAALILDAVLSWVLGAPGAQSTAQHFRVFPRALPAMFVGLALLGYHWGVVQDESRVLAGRLTGARRAFGYVLAALSLGALATGLTILLGTLIALLMPAARPLSGIEQWRNGLSWAITLLVLGGPLWFIYWRRVQRQAETGGVAERGALVRRIFLYGVQGILALAALSSFTGFLTMLLRSLLGGNASLDFLNEGKWFLATALTAGAFLVYYWQVLREDQRAGAEVVTTRKQVTLLVSEATDDLLSQLETALGVKPRVLRVVAATGPAATLTPEELATLAQQVRDAPSERVMVVATGTPMQVFGYR